MSKTAAAGKQAAVYSLSRPFVSKCLTTLCKCQFFLFNHKTAAPLQKQSFSHCPPSHSSPCIFTSIPVSWGFIFHRNKVVDSWKEWKDEHKRFWWAFFSSDLNSSCFTQWWNYLNGVWQLWRERLGSCFWVNKSNLNLRLIGLCLQGSLPKSCWTLRILIWSDLIGGKNEHYKWMYFGGRGLRCSLLPGCWLRDSRSTLTNTDSLLVTTKMGKVKRYWHLV